MGNETSEVQPSSIYALIYEEVRKIPYGKVASYSQIGRRVGGCSGRIVGFAMASLPSRLYEDVPWHRVINAKGRVSPHGFGGILQKARLEEEGIEFLPDGGIDLSVFQWLD